MKDDLQLDRTSTAKRLAEALRTRIMGGELPPGSPLRDNEIADSAGVARTTAREALQILAVEGLVRRVMHRGAEVMKLTSEDVREIYRVRSVLEQAGLDAATEQSQWTALSERVEELQAATDAVAFGAADIQFHQQLVAFLGSRQLSELEAAVLNQLRLAMSTVDRLYDEVGDQVADHRRLAEQLQHGALHEAKRTLAEHLAEAEERILASLDEADLAEAEAS